MSSEHGNNAPEYHQQTSELTPPKLLLDVMKLKTDKSSCQQVSEMFEHLVESVQLRITVLEIEVAPCFLWVFALFYYLFGFFCGFFN